MFFKFKIYFDTLLVILSLYLYINFEILLWVYFNPQGFWGYIWFFVVSFILLLSIMVLWDYIERSIMLRRLERLTFKDALYLGIFLLLGVILYTGPPLFIINILSDRYKYIKRSEVYFDEGKFSEAVGYAQRVSDRAVKKEAISKVFFIPYLFNNSEYGLQRNNVNRYQALINYAYCLQFQGGDIEKAEEYFLKCEEIAEKEFPDNPEYKILPLMGLSKIYMGKGDAIRAENCYMSILPLLANLDKSDVVTVTSTLLYYSDYSLKNGDIDKAIYYREVALNVYENSDRSKKGINYLSLLLIVASDNLNTDILRSEELANRSWDIVKNHKNKLIYVDYLKVNARLQELKGNLTEAEDLFFEILKQTSKRQGKKHPEYGKNLFETGSFYLRQGHYQKASDYLNQAIEVWASLENRNISDYYSCLMASAIADFNLDNKSKALAKAHDVEEYLINQLETQFKLLTDEERETYVVHIERYFDIINSLYIATNEPSYLARIYNNVLATKSIALQSSQQLKNFILSSRDSCLISRYRILSKKKEELSKLAVSGVKNQLLISAVRDSLLVEEKIFLRYLTNSKHYEDIKVSSVSWSDIMKNLNPEDVAIEYIKIPESFAKQDNPNYYALLVTHKSINPILIHLFKESEIESILNQDGFARDRIGKIYSENSISRLNRLIWEPTKQYITDSSTVYVSLSGILHQLAFPVFTINEACNIVYLSSTRRLVSVQDEHSTSNDRCASLFGGIDYNEDKNDSSYNRVNMIGQYQDDIRGYIQRSQFKYLPNTLIEINKISSLLTERGYSCTSLSKNKATKEAFKQLENEKPTIIHVATHGFYFPVGQDFRSRDLLFGQNAKWVANQNPLLRSGLLFAGANRKIDFGLSNNGVLTAFEISKIDFSNVDMVVLSACETGLGDVKGGEGVYGLQRAFKLAGVNSIILSLWEVPDSSTSLLMQEFYKNYLISGSKQKSLKVAQKKIRKDFPNPYYWAAFIIVE